MQTYSFPGTEIYRWFFTRASSPLKVPHRFVMSLQKLGGLMGHARRPDIRVRGEDVIVLVGIGPRHMAQRDPGVAARQIFR